MNILRNLKLLRSSSKVKYCFFFIFNAVVDLTSKSSQKIDMRSEDGAFFLIINFDEGESPPHSYVYEFKCCPHTPGITM